MLLALSWTVVVRLATAVRPKVANLVFLASAPPAVPASLLGLLCGSMLCLRPRSPFRRDLRWRLWRCRWHCLLALAAASAQAAAASGGSIVQCREAWVPVLLAA